ncbi:MAG: hypothetical protein KDD62_14305, partial [Bdellovibrionales bacterium]|nr:hypothetical protein [Bdellovibrionales bacterium]
EPTPKPSPAEDPVQPFSPPLPDESPSPLRPLPIIPDNPEPGRTSPSETPYEFPDADKPRPGCR